MITVDISKLVPQFIRNDQNGAALAKAIEAGMQIFCNTIQNGIDVIQDVSKMPEWRLDEMAWELGCLYDYNADIESKRIWIENAEAFYANFGTTEAIYNYLSGFFDMVVVEENWEYGGDPFHFRVSLGGERTAEKIAWAISAINRTKNVRSVLDDLAAGSQTDIKIKPGGEYFEIPFWFCGDYKEDNPFFLDYT